ncbi:hypothetical protein HHUSO_G2522, partial [Huso huso]
GDYIVRNISSVFKYNQNISVECFPGARVLDMSAHMENVENHKQASTAIVHVRTNDIRLRESETLRIHFKWLCHKVKQLGRNIIASGPLPVVRRGCEDFSRLLSLNNWLADWCASENLGFIDNWDSFWEGPEFFRKDGMHPSRRGSIRLVENRELYLLPREVSRIDSVAT